jgi:hypothetical protein
MYFYKKGYQENMEKINIKAILLGCAVDWAGTVAFGLLFGTIAVSLETMRGARVEQATECLMKWSATLPGTLFSLAFGLGFTCLGGYTAARVARQDSLINPAAVGSMAVLTALPFYSHSPVPVTIASLILSIPAAMLGGYFHTKKIAL